MGPFGGGGGGEEDDLAGMELSQREMEEREHMVSQLNQLYLSTSVADRETGGGKEGRAS